MWRSTDITALKGSDSYCFVLSQQRGEKKKGQSLQNIYGAMLCYGSTLFE